MEKDLELKEICQSLAKSINSTIDSYTKSLVELRKREVSKSHAELSKNEKHGLGTCPLCGQKDAPSTCTCLLSKSEACKKCGEMHMSKSICIDDSKPIEEKPLKVVKLPGKSGSGGEEAKKAAKDLSKVNPAKTPEAPKAPVVKEEMAKAGPRLGGKDPASADLTNAAHAAKPVMAAAKAPAVKLPSPAANAARASQLADFTSAGKFGSVAPPAGGAKEGGKPVMPVSPPAAPKAPPVANAAAPAPAPAAKPVLNAARPAKPGIFGKLAGKGQ